MDCRRRGQAEAGDVESYRQHLDQHIVPYIGALELSQLTVPVVRDFIDKLRAGKRSAVMIKRVVGDLGSILADAQERGLVAQNVVRSSSHRKKRREARAAPTAPAQGRGRHPLPRRDPRHRGTTARPLAAADPHRNLHRLAGVGVAWPPVVRRGLEKGGLHVRQRATNSTRSGSPRAHPASGPCRCHRSW